MKYYKTVKPFALQNMEFVFTEIPETYLKSVNDRYDRESFLTLEGIQIPAICVEINPSYFLEITEQVYKSFAVDVSPIILMITKLVEETNMTSLQIMEKLDIRLGIFRNNPTLVSYDYSENYNYPNCLTCGKTSLDACFNTVCSKRLTTNTSIKTNGTY